jgi:branched-chain amino acid transport system permease protein
MPAGVFKEAYHQVMGHLRYPIHWVSLLLGLATLALLPVLVGPYYTGLAVSIAIFTIGAIGLNMLTGMAGQISLAHGALMGVGAYTAAFLAHYGVNILLAIPVAGFTAALVGFVLGLPSFRLKGYYLAMASIAAQALLEYVFSLIDPDQYTPVPDEAKYLGPIFLGEGLPLYYTAVVVAAIMALLAANIGRSSLGRAFKAVGDNDVAAEIVGVNVTRMKGLAFAIAGLYAGVAGGVYALANTGIDWEAFTLDTSIEYLAIVLIGGPARIIWGSLLGTIVIRAGWSMAESMLADILAGAGLTIVASAAKYIILGSVVATFIILEPEGLIAVLRRVKEYFRLWPYSY